MSSKQEAVQQQPKEKEEALVYVVEWFSGCGSACTDPIYAYYTSLKAARARLFKETQGMEEEKDDWATGYLATAPMRKLIEFPAWSYCGMKLEVHVGELRNDAAFSELKAEFKDVEGAEAVLKEAATVYIWSSNESEEGSRRGKAESRRYFFDTVDPSKSEVRIEGVDWSEGEVFVGDPFAAFTESYRKGIIRLAGYG